MDMLETLGFTKEELREQIIDRAASKLLDGDVEDDGYESAIRIRINDIVRKQIDETVSRMIGDSVEPRVIEFVEGMVFQKTNGYGEPKAAPETWREYLERRATEWLGEVVNYEGKTQKENAFGSWNKSTTRVAYLIEKHLHYEISRQLTEAVSNANKSIIGGLQEAVKISLAEIAGKLKVDVKVK